MAEEGDWKKFIEEWLSIKGQSAQYERYSLAGDASNRQYFRIRFENGEVPVAVLMQKNRGEEFKKSEEAVSGGEQGPPGDPFILIARFLKRHGLPVPELYHVREDGSFILQEDLGDHTLLSRLEAHPEEEKSLTEKALCLLIDLQRLTWSRELNWLEGRSFSADLIRWEFEHFLEYGLVLPDSGTLSGLREAVEVESKILSRSFPPVLVHRDYHSRNLMVREDGSLALIDFQDLLLGSPFYDLASLLFDAYRTVPMERIEEWSRFYCERALMAGILPKGTVWGDCFTSLARHAFQRNLKACGRFFYIADVKRNPSFLVSVAGTHRNMARLASIVPELGPFYEKILPFLRFPEQK